MAQFNALDYLLLVIVHPQDVKIDSREVGTGEKKRLLRTQSAYFKKPSRVYPEFFKFSLPDDQVSAYPAGNYFLHPDSFASGDYDSIDLNRFGMRLVPVPPEMAQLVKAG